MTLPPLRADQFGAVFEAMHGAPPFPWQARLAQRLADGGGWPAVLDLPTGSGKTAAIDAALFHLAISADQGPRRAAPVRIAFVVDRRIIVDAAADRANRIASALEAAQDGSPLGRMAARLRYLAGPGAPPLLVRTLRGGLPREDDWARSPGQPTVLCSTVDQVGSRLLFRGYGVTDVMKPIHAGLLGSDCLILLDEAHLSTPFAQTLERVGRYRAPAWCTEAPGPWAVVALTATPRGTAPEFGLVAADRANSTLAKRLGASKPARLRALPGTTRDAAHATAFVAAAQGLLVPPARSVAVVVNRVALARAVHAELMAALGETAQVELLTGRVREHDRDTIVPRMEAGLRGGKGAKPLIVVATQTIEAGADYDFDALVTQVAPIDALRQRFGRLNRTGRDIPALAVIIAAKDEIAARAEDPVYGNRAKLTWDWLAGIAEQPEPAAKPRAVRKRSGADPVTTIAPAKAEPVVDFGIDALAMHLADADLAALATHRAGAPVLRPADVLLLSWTAPVPAVDPDLAQFLHGLEAAPADVQLVWRADVKPDMPLDTLKAVLDAAPPHARETLAVPLWTAREWLAGSRTTDVADLEGAPGEAPRSETGRSAFRWAGAESPRTGVVSPGDIRPGDVLVLPVAYGGCDGFGWNPAFIGAVSDLGDEVAPRAAARWRRLHQALFSDTEWPAVRAAIADDDRSPRERDGAIGAALGLPAEVRWVSRSWPGYDGVVLVFRRGQGDRGLIASTEADAGLAAGAPISLGKHVDDVVGFAERFAAAAGLLAVRAADVRLAAELHDAGKADERFQILLHGGDRLAALDAAAPLGKSGAPPRRGDNARAGLPERWRHEAQSVARAVRDERLAGAADAELVLWLIGTHHGHGRPFFPHHDPREPEGLHGPQRLDFDFRGHDWAELYERLKARYGPWELARLEAVLRLADHRASAMETAA